METGINTIYLLVLTVLNCLITS